MKAALPPKLATPAAVLADEPPEIWRFASVEVGRALRVDEVHDALRHAFALEEIGVDRGDNIDDRIADGEHVEKCVSHRPPCW
jgi:hypothetical protein